MENKALNCGHECGGGCCAGGACGGWGRVIELTQAELDLLQMFAQIPFLPVARQNGSGNPVFLETDIDAEETLDAAITALEKKGLIQIDYEIPLRNFNYAAYEEYPYKGSMALTAKGQTVVEILEIQGIEAP